MRELRGWLFFIWYLLRYFAYRLGIGQCPSFLKIYPEMIYVFDRFMRWPKRLRVEGAEYCPRTGPAVFSANHFAKDDPFILYRAIHRVCEGAYPVRYMMRDDFFKGLSPIFKSKLLDVDELAKLFGTLQISRDRVQLAQLKPFITLLREHAAFIMYPGRSRSRTGAFIEYRDGIEEPGGVTFLIAQAQRNNPDLSVAAVPVARTHNLVSKQSTVAFGPPVFLPHDAGRATQRALDFKLIELMGDMVEVNVPHIVAGVLYLHCLHARKGAISVEELDRVVNTALNAVPARKVDPAVKTDRRKLVENALSFFAQQGFVSMERGGVVPHCEKILAAPPQDTTYVKLNPVKYTLNQVLHLSDVIDAIESAHADLAH